jgi:hypothetical protein
MFVKLVSMFTFAAAFTSEVHCINGVTILFILSVFEG